MHECRAPCAACCKCSPCCMFANKVFPGCRYFDPLGLADDPDSFAELKVRQPLCARCSDALNRSWCPHASRGTAGMPSHMPGCSPVAAC